MEIWDIRRQNYRILPTATEFCRQPPNFADRDTEFCRQRYRILQATTKYCRQNYRILPTATEFYRQLPNFTDIREVGNELTFSPSAPSRVDGCEDARVEMSVSMCLVVRMMCLVVLCIATLCDGDSISTRVTLSTREWNSP